MNINFLHSYIILFKCPQECIGIDIHFVAILTLNNVKTLWGYGFSISL